MFRKARWFLAFLACCLFAGRLLAGDAAADFSDGFRRLIALGLPDLDPSARWVKHSAANQLSYQQRELISKLKGNCWAIPAADGETKGAILPMGGLEPVETTASRLPKATADLTKDIEMLIGSLEGGDARQDRIFETMGVSTNRFEGGNAGNILIFAAQLHQNGHGALANRLAAAVLARSPSPEAMVDFAVSQIATTAYHEITSRFFEDHDFKAYHAALVGLNERFPRGWSDAPAVAMFLPQLARQAAGENPPPPALDGVALDPDAVAAADALCRPPAAAERPRRGMAGPGGHFMGHGSYVPELWVLAGGDTGEAAGPQAGIIRLGMKAIPVLAALADDPFLTCQPNSGGQSYYYSSRESEEARLLRAYQTMARPRSRGEIARELLAATLPDGNFDPDEADADTLRTAALDFWKENRDKSPDDLMLVFLKQGSSSQSSQAAGLLASSSDPAAHAAFEEHALNAENPLELIAAAATYLRARRTEGKPFLVAYSAKVREFAKQAGDDLELSWEIRNAGGVEKALRTLEALVSGESPRAVARRIARGDPGEAATAIKSLAALVEDSPPTRQLYAYLEGANAATDPTIRSHFLSQTFEIPWHEEDEDEEDEDGPEPIDSDDEDGYGDGDDTAEPPPREMPEAEIKVWRKLLTDTRPVPESLRRRMELDDDSTLGRLAAIAAEYSVSRETAMALHRLTPALGKPVHEFLGDRATARFAGKPVPPVPSAARVSDERLAEIVAAAAGLPADEIRPFLDRLNPDERVKWIEWYADPEDPPFPPGLLKANNRLVARSKQSIWGLRDSPGVMGFQTGFVFDWAALEPHLASLAANPADHSPGVAFIGPGQLGPGIEVLAIKLSPPSDKPAEDEDSEDGEDEDDSIEEEDDESRDPSTYLMEQLFRGFVSPFADLTDFDGIVIANINTEDGQHNQVWSIREGKLIPFGTGGGDDGEENDADEDNGRFGSFSQLLDSAVSTTERKRLGLRIQFISREHAEILNRTHE